MHHKSFLEPILLSASEHGKRTAFCCDDKTATYDELFGIAQAIRSRLNERGVPHGRRIGIVTGDTVETYASLLAVWSLGAAYVPLNVHNPAERNAAIINQAGLEVIVSSRSRTEWPRHLPEAAFTSVVCTTGLDPRPGTLALPERDPSDLAYLFFTSGSTGAPKGVPISHGNLSAFMDTVLTQMSYDFDSSDRFLQMFELTFDLSVVSILAPWSVGGCCCVVPERGIAYMNILKTIEQQQVTVALMVPSVLQYMQRFFGEVRFPALRLSQFCGEALMQDMAAEWSQCVPNARIENMYGPTEATIYCTRYEWARERAATESVNGIVPIGNAMPGTRTVVIDTNGNPCEEGARGELCLSGNQVMTGYWKNPEKTEQTFVSFPGVEGDAKAYRTGDIAYVSSSGGLIYCGRLDSQVKIDGHRVELAEIEHFARQFIGSSAAAVVVAGDRSATGRLHLFIGLENIDRAGLEQCLKANLPNYMWPTSTTVLSELPLNRNGKIDRPALVRLANGSRTG